MKIKSKELIECLEKNIEKVNWTYINDCGDIGAHVNKSIYVKICFDDSPHDLIVKMLVDGKYYEVREDQDILKSLYKKIKDYIYKKMINDTNNAIEKTISAIN